MFCKYCGKALDDKVLDEKGIIFCSNCGKENRKQKSKKQLIDESNNKEELLESKQEKELKVVENKQALETKEDKKLNEAMKLANNPAYEAKIYHKDSGSVGWGILGFFIPIVGIILYFCWIRTSPRSANSAGAGALIMIVLCILAALLMVILTLFCNVQLPAEFYY